MASQLLHRGRLIDHIQLVVSDIEASRRFYLDGLGWSGELEVEGDVVMIKSSKGIGFAKLVDALLGKFPAETTTSKQT